MATIFTMKGRDICTGRFIGATPTQAEPKIVCWGLNPNALTAATKDIALYQESAEARTSGAATQQTTTTVNDTYQVIGTITATNTRVIQEAALADSTTQPTTNTVAAAGVVSSAVSTTLNTGTAFSPGNNNFIQIRNELMQVTAGSGTSALTVVRQNNVPANQGGGGAAIATIAISDIVTPGNPPGQTAIVGGTLFTHADFAAINLNTSDSISFTWKISVS